MKTNILTISPNGNAKVYSSVRAASRVLTGFGSESLKDTINRRVNNGGGYVKNVWVQGTTLPVGE